MRLETLVKRVMDMNETKKVTVEKTTELGNGRELYRVTPVIKNSSKKEGKNVTS